jgi:hypothetical protein
MATEKTTDKKYIVSNGIAVITETKEKTLNREELLREKIEYMSRQQQLLNQIKQIQIQHDAFNDVISELDKMISEIDASQKNT